MPLASLSHARWWFTEKIWSGDKLTVTLGYDLLGWALPLFVDKEDGEFRLRLLCIYLSVAWDID